MPWPCLSLPSILRHSSPSTPTPPQHLVFSIAVITRGLLFEELKEMDEECCNEVLKHPHIAWIFFYQEQCKLKDDGSLKPMSKEEIYDKWRALGDHAKRKYKKKSIRSFEKYKEHKIKLIFRRLRMWTQLKAADGRMQELDPLQVESVKAMGFGENVEPIRRDIGAMHEKDSKRKYSATNGGINKKDTPSALEEPDVEGHFKTKKAKCTEKALSDQMTSSLKTNKEKGKEEAKLNASSKRLRKMAANVCETLSCTAPVIDGKNKWEKKLRTNRFDKSQPLKRNANEEPTMEAEPKRVDVMATLSNEKHLMLKHVFDHT
ncbi:hypothetical protein RHSIM_Rhsim01G0094500 [Rhododendron simsii]|uniref:Uncharacterized protein n=1 Tax=Rhododendron simsii TaxID=118357 RepID=A0A834HHT9_RHOSS|nr:hypothetical protein RHSIM_Rhsim01G0094500 [Rhododendron simsii]